MKSSTSRTTGSAKSGRFVLTRSKGEKISAVEGMKLTERMARILDRSARAGLSGDERRSLIKEQVRGK
jgi:hypothetical protein